ncbi:hypothetical protein SAMN05192566_0536 [Methylophilus rhizosphaerae]|uniref:DUF2489 domain-containing protein n=1 Tax=Methylophilus rhizosphaerae TaxID=492660 RepID=A0A1G8ZUX3_9PROT|nr:hypothetical protein [Methylophilus rhizosphaerae]SDK18916.1 hypothetical protein SAMN05192566_0536 [Methylophilus rhizosphaerae]
MDLTNSDFISIGSALVVGLSVLYARWAVKASKHQNEISLHAERLNVYKGVTIFGAKLAANGPSIQETDVWKFHEWVQLSEFYYNIAIHQRLDTAFTQALVMLTKNDEWKLAKEQGSANTTDISNERHKIHRALRDECFSISDAIKENLRLAKA